MRHSSFCAQDQNSYEMKWRLNLLISLPNTPIHQAVAHHSRRSGVVYLLLHNAVQATYELNWQNAHVN